MLIEGWITTYI